MFTKNINTKIKQEIDEKINICFHYITAVLESLKLFMTINFSGLLKA